MDENYVYNMIDIFVFCIYIFGVKFIENKVMDINFCLKK